MNDLAGASRADGPIRVLLLEDDARDAELAERALAQAGLAAAVRRVETREAFMEGLRRFLPQVVLADFKLPGFDGRAALDLVRAEFPAIPVIMVSGTIGDEHAVELVKAGATDYVLKDNLVRLAPAVRRALAEAQERRRRLLAERAVEESELRFRSLIETGSDIVAVAKPDGTITYVSPAVREVGGYAPAELIGRNYLDLVHPEDLPRARGTLKELADGAHDPLRRELRYRRKDGGVIWLEAVARNLTGVPGVDGIVVNLRDVTFRKEAEARLRLAGLLIEQSPAVLFRWHAAPGWPVAYVSENVRQWGYEPADLIAGRPPYAALIHPDDLPRVAEEVATRSAAGAAQFAQEYRIVKRSGEVIWVDDRSTVERDITGHPVFLQGVVTDVTVSKQAALALLENEQTLRAITAAAMDGVVLLDHHGTIVFWNEAAERIYGHPRAEALGQKRTLVIPARDYAVFWDGYESVRTTGTGPRVGHRAEFPAVRKDGTEIVTEVSLSTVRLKGEWYSVEVIRDITAQKQAEAVRQASFARAVAQVDALGRVTTAEALGKGAVETLARQITELAAQVAGAERANVWLFSDDETELRCIDLFEATPGRHSSGVVLKEAEFRNEFQALKSAPYVDAHDPLTDPRTAGYVEGYLKPLGITSMLDAVIRASGRHFGLLCIEHVGRPHRWEQDEIGFTCQMADRLGLCIANRERFTIARELEEAQRIAGLGSWRIVPATGEVTWSAGIYRILGLDPGTAPPGHAEVGTMMTAPSFERLNRAIAACRKSGEPYEIELEVIRPDGGHRWMASRGEPVRDASGAIVALRGTTQDITGRKAAEHEQQRLAEQLRRGLTQTVQSLAGTVEMRDPYTAGHQRRVAAIATAMAGTMGLPAERIEGLALAATIHDIGKINVPAEILAKPGRLSAIEYELVKGHAEAGYWILKDVDFPWPIAEMIRQHHERADGSGYPRGLRSDQILPEAKILAVADVVEALASHRPYRAAKGLDAALGEIAKGRGTVFDADAVDACVKLFRENAFRIPE